YRIAAKLLAFWISSPHRHRAAFAIRGDYDATAGDGLATLFGVQPQNTVIDLCIRPGIFIRIASDRIVSSVELAEPFVMRRFTVSVYAVHSDFHFVTCRLIHNLDILWRPWRQLRLCFVQFPSTHIWVLGKGQCKAYMVHCECQDDFSCVHAAS